MIGNSQKGVSLIITFFIMIIILVAVLVISTILYSQIKVIRNIGNSVVSFYAADSGVEKVLFFDKQAVPYNATRGLCSMFVQTIDPSDGTFPPYCSADTTPTGCNNPTTIVLDPLNHPDGCDPAKCNDCEIDFTTAMSSDKNYTVRATITPGLTGQTNNLSINSTGSYQNVDRAVNLFITKAVSQQIIQVVYATATPRSVENGTAVDIEAEATSPNGIATVTAYIKPSIANDWSGDPSKPICTSGTYNGTCYVLLTCSNENIQDRTCNGGPILPTGVYYVDLSISDTHGINLIDANIPPYIQ